MLAARELVSAKKVALSVEVIVNLSFGIVMTIIGIIALWQGRRRIAGRSASLEDQVDIELRHRTPHLLSRASTTQRSPEGLVTNPQPANFIYVTAPGSEQIIDEAPHDTRLPGYV
ncbi:MAG: hypothetical protein M1812_000379 [Candelaria pacifica]|nr:MAG: hypothetical protein M1812_000379 [Candelaria pacifica]